MKKQGAYIYTRVSTAIQTEGYSLEAQRQKVLDYAKYRGFVIRGEYSDAGFSGKNIAGRVQFQQMLEDIENKKDDVQYVLVFKLSRFGRNAADVLNSLQFMQDYGVNLICVEDNIDSSADTPDIHSALKLPDQTISHLLFDIWHHIIQSPAPAYCLYTRSPYRH